MIFSFLIFQTKTMSAIKKYNLNCANLLAVNTKIDRIKEKHIC